MFVLYLARLVYPRLAYHDFLYDQESIMCELRLPFFLERVVQTTSDSSRLTPNERVSKITDFVIAFREVYEKQQL